jgi:hypothetical protein
MILLLVLLYSDMVQTENTRILLFLTGGICLFWNGNSAPKKMT